MEIEKVEDFKFVKMGNKRQGLLIESKKLKKTIELIKREGISKIELNVQWGYKEKNIDPLVEVADYIKEIEIVNDDIDLGLLDKFTQLRKIYIGGDNNSPIDFSYFKYLERCNIFWHKKLKNINSCKKLKELMLRKFILSTDSIQFVENLPGLEQLGFIQGKFEDLDLLKNFKHLREFGAFYISALKNIDGLKNVLGLEKLEIGNCKKIEDYDILGELVKLEYLIISGSSSLPSLDAIKPLKKLKHFSFVGTNVSDGNLAPLTGIKYVGFDDKKHYSHKMKDINKAS